MKGEKRWKRYGKKIETKTEKKNGLTKKSLFFSKERVGLLKKKKMCAH